MYKFIEEPEKNNFNESIQDTLSHLDKRNKLLNIQSNKTKENIKLINQYEKKITNVKQNIITKKEEIKNIKELVNMKRKGKINILNLFKSYISILDDKNQCLNEKIDYIYKKELLIKYKEKIISNIYNSNNSMNNIINNHNKKEDTKINELNHNFSLTNRYLHNNNNNKKNNLEKISFNKKNLNNNFFLNNRKVSASSKNFNKSLTNNYNMNICNYNRENINIIKRNSAKNMFKNNTSKSRLESSSYFRNKKNVNNSSINSKESEIYLSDDEEFNKFLKNYKIMLDKNVSRNNLLINNKKSSSTNLLSNFHYNNSTKAGSQKTTLEKKINIPKKQVFLSQNEKSKEKNYYMQKENKKKIFYPLYNLGSFQQTHYSKNSATNNFSYSLLNNTKSKNNSSANLNNTNLNSTTYNNFYLKTARDNINKIKDPKLKQKIFNIVVTSELSERENFNNNNQQNYNNNNNNNHNINNFNFNFNYNNNYLNNFHNSSNGYFYNDPNSNRENNKHSRNLNYLHKHNTNQTKSMKNLKRNNMLMSKDEDFSKEVKKNTNKNTLFFNMKNKIEENKKKYINKKFNILLVNISKLIEFKIKKFQKDFLMKLKNHNNFLYLFKKWNESNKKGKCISRMLYLTFKKYNDIIKEKIKQNLVNDDEFLNQLYKTEESVKGNLSDYEGGLNQLKNITRETKQIEQFLNNFTQSINNKI